MSAKFALTTLFVLISISNLYTQVTQEWVALYKGIGNSTEIVTIKYNSSGEMQWHQNFIDDINNYNNSKLIKLDNKKNVYVGGVNNSGMLIIKYNSRGSLLWSANYKGPESEFDFLHSMGIDSSGDVYITGSSEGIGTDLDYATIKYNSSGVQQWVQRYNSPYNKDDESKALVVDNLGNVFVTGYVEQNNSFNTSCVTIKYNTNGVQMR